MSGLMRRPAARAFETSDACIVSWASPSGNQIESSVHGSIPAAMIRSGSRHS
ncbi:MAG: hypothetical protein RI885_1756, partial [Actinomycetota bacterium]